VWAGLAATTSFGTSTILGGRIVRIEPQPTSLATAMSPHHLTEAPADHETKARATVFAGRRGRGLGKLLEQHSTWRSRIWSAWIVQQRADGRAPSQFNLCRSRALGKQIGSDSLLRLSRNLIVKPGQEFLEAGIARRELYQSLHDGLALPKRL
jgi:hypothetical protein